MDTSKLVTLAAVGVGGYFVYEWLNKPAASATATAVSGSATPPPVGSPAGAPGGSAASPVTSTPPPAAPVVPAVPVPTLQQLLNAVVGDPNFTNTLVPGDNRFLQASPHQWNFYMARLLGTDAPDPGDVFPGVDASLPMTAAIYWAGVDAWLKKNHGMAGLAALFRGLGVLPSCSDIGVDPGFVGPVNCDPSEGGIAYSPSSSQFANLSSEVQALMERMTGGGTASGAPAPTFTNWLNQHGTVVALGAAGFVVVMLATRR